MKSAFFPIGLSEAAPVFAGKYQTDADERTDQNYEDHDGKSRRPTSTPSDGQTRLEQGRIQDPND